MSRRLAPAILVGLCLLTGCHNWPYLRRERPTAAVPTAGGAPTAASLVAYLNENANHVRTLESRSLDIDARQGGQSIGLTGALVCQKPRNFRLNAKVVGQPGVDIGSNDREFWYWISKAEPPYLIHCSYEDLGKGAALGFPFQPEWILVALGMGSYDPASNYQLKETATALELVEQTTSSQGQPVRKVTTFSRGRSQSGRPQVTGHELQDGSGKVICSAKVLEAFHDQGSGATVPRRVQLTWPAEKIELKMRLDGLQVNGQLDPNRMAVLFNRPNLPNIPSYDLGRRQLDSQPTGVQRAGGVFRR